MATTEWRRAQRVGMLTAPRAASAAAPFLRSPFISGRRSSMRAARRLPRCCPPRCPPNQFYACSAAGDTALNISEHNSHRTGPWRMAGGGTQPPRVRTRLRGSSHMHSRYTPSRHCHRPMAPAVLVKCAVLPLALMREPVFLMPMAMSFRLPRRCKARRSPRSTPFFMPRFSRLFLSRFSVYAATRQPLRLAVCYGATDSVGARRAVVAEGAEAS